MDDNNPYSRYLSGKIVVDADGYRLGDPKNVDYKIKTELHSGAFRQCFTCGTVVTDSMLQFHDDYHMAMKNRPKGNAVATAAWCDPGNHAFKAGEDGSVDYTASVIKGGIRTTQIMDACAEHSPFRDHAEEARKELEAAYPVKDDNLA